MKKRENKTQQKRQSILQPQVSYLLRPVTFVTLDPQKDWREAEIAAVTVIVLQRRNSDTQDGTRACTEFNKNVERVVK